MNRKWLKVGGLTVRYYEAGDGPPVLFVHGAGATARLWRRQLGPLSEPFRVLAPDLPGFGGSDPFPWIKSVRDYGRFMAAFLDSLGVFRTSVVASSLGGWAACWFALDFPERLDRLALISPAGLYCEDDPPMPIQRVIKELEGYYSAAAVSDERARLKSEGELKKAVETINALSAAGGLEPDLDGRLSGIRARTLIIWGTEDKVVPVSYAYRFRDGISGSDLSIMEGAGHLPYVERSEDINAAISGLMKHV